MAEEDDREVKKAKSANRGEILTTLFFGIVIGYLIANPPEDFFTGSLPLIVALIGTPWILHRLAKRWRTPNGGAGGIYLFVLDDARLIFNMAAHHLPYQTTWILILIL